MSPAAQGGSDPRLPDPKPAEQRLALRVQRRWPVLSAAGALGLVLLLGWLVTVRGGRLGVDAEWMGELVEHRSAFWEVPALAMDFLGGGWFGVLVVPIGIAVVLLLSRHRWGALCFVLSSIASAGLVQVLKHAFGRARPPEILVTSDFGSFPSGHVANAATIALTLAIVLGYRWLRFAGAAYVLLMLLSRTYLGAHWLTDTLGGLVVGAGVAVVLWAPFAHRLLRERSGRRDASAHWSDQDPAGPADKGGSGLSSGGRPS